MKTIKLQNSDQEATCDDEDFEYLNQFRWFLDSEGYVIRFDTTNQEVIEMGYEVMKRAGKL